MNTKFIRSTGAAMVFASVITITSAASASASPNKPQSSGPSTSISAIKAPCVAIQNAGESSQIPMTEQDIVAFNKARIELGKKTLPTITRGLIIPEDLTLESIPVDASGNHLEWIPATSPSTASVRVQDAGDIVRRAFRSCLGLGTDNAIKAEGFFHLVFNPKMAAKFLVRRLGWIGAVSCAYGLITEFL